MSWAKIVRLFRRKLVTWFTSLIRVNMPFSSGSSSTLWVTTPPHYTQGGLRNGSKMVRFQAWLVASDLVDRAEEMAIPGLPFAWRKTSKGIEKQILAVRTLSVEVVNKRMDHICDPRRRDLLELKPWAGEALQTTVFRICLYNTSFADP